MPTTRKGETLENVARLRWFFGATRLNPGRWWSDLAALKHPMNVSYMVWSLQVKSPLGWLREVSRIPLRKGVMECGYFHRLFLPWYQPATDSIPHDNLGSTVRQPG
jgi:hypothetical protein